MKISKKIILFGPPGTGKTTIKKVFFEMANPILLLENSLKPTRGVNSSIFTLFQQNLGVFDLAGQENEDWLSKDKEVFKFADMIIVVLDINAYVKDILEVIRNILGLYEEMKLKCQVIVLLHKIDLIDSLYLHHKLEHVNKELENIEKNKVKVYTTSIAKDFFLNMIKIFSDIISVILKQENIILNDSDIQDFKLDLQILLKYEISKVTSVEQLFYDFNLKVEASIFHLLRLQQLGFVELMGDSKKFKLTEKVNFLKPSINGTIESKKNYQINKILESLFIFSNLKKA